jgi:hypothetical protein
MNSKQINWYFSFSAGLLLLTGFAKLYASTGAATVYLIQDQLLHLGYRRLMLFASLLEMAVALFLVTSRSDLKRCLVLLWLSSNFLLYRLGNYLLRVHLCPCLGHLSDRLPLPKGLADVLVQVLALFWFLSSLNLLWSVWGGGKWQDLRLIAIGSSENMHPDRVGTRD